MSGPLRRIEHFDYPDGYRFFDGDFVYLDSPVLARFGSPFETNGNSQAVIGRGPYVTDTWADEEDSLWTGWGVGLTCGVSLWNAPTGGDYYPDPYVIEDKRNQTYEFCISAGSPGPHGTGIFWPYRDRLLQICWNQEDGVWAEFVYGGVKEVVPLAPPNPDDPVTVGIASLRYTGDPGDLFDDRSGWNFYIDGEIAAANIRIDGSPAGVVLDEPRWLGGSFPEDRDALMRLYVINPVDPDDLEPWGTRDKDFLVDDYWGGPERDWPPPPPPASQDIERDIYYYDGPRYPVLEWMHTWHGAYTPNTIVGQIWPRGNW